MPQKVLMLNETHPTDCPVLLKVRSDYADWHITFDHGYIRYWRSRNNKLTRKYEHKLVAEQAYGSVPKGHHVHHANEIRTDNRAENLSIVSPKEHVNAHGRVAQFVDTTCAHCGKPLRIYHVQFRKSKDSYCDQVCSHEGLKPVEWPTPEKLFEQMQAIRNFSAIGRMYGVSDNTIRNWAKQYDLDLSMCDGRKKRVTGIEPVDA